MHINLPPRTTPPLFRFHAHKPSAKDYPTPLQIQETTSTCWHTRQRLCTWSTATKAGLRRGSWRNQSDGRTGSGSTSSCFHDPSLWRVKNKNYPSRNIYSHHTLPSKCTTPKIFRAVRNRQSVPISCMLHDPGVKPIWWSWNKTNPVILE